MYFKAFYFLVRMQMYTVNPASPSTRATSLSLKDSAFLYSRTAGKGRWGTPVTLLWAALKPLKEPRGS